VIETRNAQISKVEIETDPVLTAWVILEYGGAGQGFGGWTLDEPIWDADGKFSHRQGTAWGMEFIRLVMETVGASKWSALKGMSCRVRADHGKAYEIGHFLKDVWFQPERDLAHLLEQRVP